MAPRVDSLSKHRISVGDDQPDIFIYGSGFQDVTSVMIGDTMVEQLTIDDQSVITIKVPHLTPTLSTGWSCTPSTAARPARAMPRCSPSTTSRTCRRVRWN